MRSSPGCARRMPSCAKSEISCEKQWPSSQRPLDEVPAHRGASSVPQRGEDGQHPGRVTQWVLCLEVSVRKPAEEPGEEPGGAHPGDPEPGEGPLRKPPHQPGTGPHGPVGGPQSGGAAAGRPQSGGETPKKVPADHEIGPQPRGGREPAGEAIHRRATQPGVGERHQLPPHRRRVAVLGGGAGPVRPQGGRLGAGHLAGCRVGRAGSPHGLPASPPCGGAAVALGSGRCSTPVPGSERCRPLGGCGRA